MLWNCALKWSMLTLTDFWKMHIRRWNIKLQDTLREVEKWQPFSWPVHQERLISSGNNALNPWMKRDNFDWQGSSIIFLHVTGGIVKHQHGLIYHLSASNQKIEDYVSPLINLCTNSSRAKLALFLNNSPMFLNSTCIQITATRTKSENNFQKLTCFILFYRCQWLFSFRYCLFKVTNQKVL